MPEVFLFKKIEDKDACFLLLFLNTKIKHSSFASKQMEKIDRSRGVLLVGQQYHWLIKALLINWRWLRFSKVIDCQ